MELQRACVLALKGATSVTDLVGLRIYDRVPEKVAYPYLAYEEEIILDDDDECGEHWECTVNLHAWSTTVGSVEAKSICSAVTAALESISSVTGFRVGDVQFLSQRILKDRDGVTTHGVVTFYFHISAT